MTRYFVAPDADREPTIWRATDREPIAMLRRCDLHHAGREELWAALVAGLDPAAIWEQGRAAGAALFPAQADENPYPTYDNHDQGEPA